MNAIETLPFDTEAPHKKELTTKGATIRVADAWAKRNGPGLKPRIVLRMAHFAFAEIKVTKTHGDPATRLARVVASVRDATWVDPRWNGTPHAWDHCPAMNSAILGG